MSPSYSNCRNEDACKAIINGMILQSVKSGVPCSSSQVMENVFGHFIIWHYRKHQTSP
ncbi:hypothetical protein DAI22_10g051900 [Oryza sativa Japonica Group]|nr:hypothetical protein DAI22_10g051900 [Oryza sativa Japonica Group]